VAIAGPLVNVAIAAVLWAGLQAAGAPVVPAGGNVAALPFAAQFLWVNVMLVVFNLIPAFPMDGGRVLRALLAMRMSRVRATQVAATLGKVFAFGFGLLGLYSNPMLVLIAVFVWVGATSEASGVRLEAALGHRTVRDAMITQFDVLHPHDPVSRAVERTLAGFQRDFPVVDGARLAGLLTQQDLVRALALHGPDVPVAEVMQRAVTVVSAATPVTEAMPKVLGPSRSTVLVVEDGRVAGLLTADNLAELLVFSEAAGRQR
jgi:CBS domain-containing protein